MNLHSTLDGRAGGFRVRGAAWERSALAFRGFLYLIPARGGANGRHRVVEAEADSLWSLLDALSEQVTLISRAPVARLNARVVVGPKKSARRPSGDEATHLPAREFETA